MGTSILPVIFLLLLLIIMLRSTVNPTVGFLLLSTSANPASVNPTTINLTTKNY